MHALFGILRALSFCTLSSRTRHYFTVFVCVCRLSLTGCETEIRIFLHLTFNIPFLIRRDASGLSTWNARSYFAM